MRRVPSAIAACAFGAGLLACASGEPVALAPLESGAQSGVTERSFRVVVDENAFRELHASVHSLRMPPPRPPEVDFAANVVLVAFLGRRSTGGYGIGFGEASVEHGVARATVVKWSPSPGAILTQAITTSYAMATLPRDGIEVVELVDDGGAILLRTSLPPARSFESRESGAGTVRAKSRLKQITESLGTLPDSGSSRGLGAGFRRINVDGACPRSVGLGLTVRERSTLCGQMNKSG